MKTKTKIDTCVVALRDLLRSELGTIFVCLYHHGSRLSGDADPESDYDVVCVTSRQLTRQEKNHLVDRSLDIQFERGVVYDLHFYSRTEIATPPLSCTPFLVHLQEEGVLV
jgi:predicted nucleotidyltransferase